MSNALLIPTNVKSPFELNLIQSGIPPNISSNLAFAYCFFCHIFDRLITVGLGKVFINSGSIIPLPSFQHRKVISRSRKFILNYIASFILFYYPLHNYLYWVFRLRLSDFPISDDKLFKKKRLNSRTFFLILSLHMLF